MKVTLSAEEVATLLVLGMEHEDSPLSIASGMVPVNVKISAGGGRGAAGPSVSFELLAEGAELEFGGEDDDPDE